MLHLEKITFVDDETQKEISVYLDGRVESNQPITPEEYCIASFHSGLMVSGGISNLKKMLQS